MSHAKPALKVDPKYPFSEHLKSTTHDVALDASLKLDEHQDLEQIEETQPGSFVWLCASAAAIGGMLFGYDTGVISGVLVVIGSDLDGRPLTSSEKEYITALCAAGALVGAIVAGLTPDKYGRRPAIWFAAVLFTLGALVQAASFSIIRMCVGRFLIGLGVGSASTIMPLYIAELSPARYRGRMISVDMVYLGTGSILAYGFDAAFHNVAHGWRYMIGVGGIISILLGGLLFWCPESPRQLIFHGRRNDCERVLRQIYPNATDEHVEKKMMSLELGVAQAKAFNEEISFRTASRSFITVPANFRALVAACGIMLFQQMCGFNTMMYYSSTLFSIVGFDNPVAVVFFIDRIGRRRILLWTMWGMPLTLAIVAVAFHWIRIDLQTLELVDDKIGAPAYVVLAMLVLFVAFYAAGLGCVPWQANEFLPMEVRALGTMMMNIFIWAPNIIVSATFLSMVKGITPSGAFGFYAGMSFLGWVFVIFCFPEAANMTLEEIRAVFRHGFGVKFAEEWRKQRRIRKRRHKNAG